MKTALQIASCLFILSFFIAVPSALAQPADAKGTGSAPPSGDAELAQELSNPLADLMTIPIQMNYMTAASVFRTMAGSCKRTSSR